MVVIRGEDTYAKWSAETAYGVPESTPSVSLGKLQSVTATSTNNLIKVRALGEGINVVDSLFRNAG